MLQSLRLPAQKSAGTRNVAWGRRWYLVLEDQHMNLQALKMAERKLSAEQYLIIVQAVGQH